MGWAFGIITWATTAAWLIFVGMGVAMTLWPTLETTILLVGWMEMVHACVVDARLGHLPAPVDQD